MAGRRILFLLWLAVSAAQASTPRADALWRAGDYRGAFAQAFEPAAHGDRQAQYLLGEAYRLGRSVEADFTQAADYYVRAARQGHVAAASALGLMLATQHRAGEAAPWLSVAAIHGEARAACALASLYYNGDGIARDPVLAFALMTRASAAGLEDARLRLITLRFALSPEEQIKGAALAAGAWAVMLRPALVVPAVTIPTTRQARIQIGAFRSREAAERAWSLLATRIDGAGQIAHIVVRAGPIYRLQASLDDADAAADFRRKLDGARWQHFTRRGASGNGSDPT